MPVQPSILVGLAPNAVWVQVHGRGSFQNSSGLKQFAREMMDRGHRDFFVDLRECPMMDSTFMGTLTGIALRLRDREGEKGVLRVVNSNTRNVELLSGLGLDQILEVDINPVAAPCTTSPEPVAALQSVAKREITETMCDAHESLCEADERNRCKFKDLLEYLKTDLKAVESVNGR